MKKSDFVCLLEELLEKDPNTLNIADSLNSISNWDSLAVIGYIAVVDQNFGITVPAAKINDCKTVGDLLLLVADHLVD